MAASSLLALAPDMNDSDCEGMGDSSSLELCGSDDSGSGGSWAGWPASTAPAHKRHKSCPAALLRCCISSNALDCMSDCEEEAQEPSPAWSPALQASVAAWQSANSLLRELQHLQQEPPLPPAELLPALQPAPQPPAAQEQAAQQPAWLQAALLAAPAQPGLALRAASDGAAAMMQTTQ